MSCGEDDLPQHVSFDTGSRISQLSLPQLRHRARMDPLAGKAQDPLVTVLLRRPCGSLAQIAPLGAER